MAVLKILFRKLRKNDDDVMDVFWSWVTQRSVQEVRNEVI
jgi:hypothetical protein